MQNPSLRTPLGVLAAGLVIIAVLLRPEQQQVANSQSYGAPATTSPTADPYGAPATNTPATQAQPTASQAGATPATTGASPTSAAATLAPTATTRPTAAQPTAAPIAPTATPTPSTQVCAPGQTLYIVGSAPARAALLLYFGQRAVGGGSAEASGRYSIPLRVGDEKPGDYEIIVRVRGSMQELQRTHCTVPIVPTPTATP
jgi:hypothetical protein